MTTVKLTPFQRISAVLSSEKDMEDTEMDNYSDSLSLASTLSGDEDHVVVLMPNRHVQRQKKSFIWNHFTILNVINDELERKWAQCSYCETKYKLTEAGRNSTGNMVNHLRKHYSEKIQQGPQQSKGIPVFSQEKYRQALVNWVVKTRQPFTAPEQSSFVDLVLSLNPEAHTISNDTVQRDIVAEYELKLKLLKAIFKEVPGTISFTHDAWTSKNQISFLCIRAHWITKDWTQRSVVVDFSHVKGSHSGSNLYKLFKKAIDMHQIPVAKIQCVTMDNASNNNTFMDALRDENDEVGYQITSPERRIRCLAHILNLAVQDLLKSLRLEPEEEEVSEFDDYDEPSTDGEIEDMDSQTELDHINDDDLADEVLDDLDLQMPEQGNDDDPFSPIVTKLRTLVKCLRSSGPVIKKFRKFCRFHRLRFLRPIIDVKTRWNSTFHMIKRAQYLKSPLITFCSSQRMFNRFIISEAEWKDLDRLSSLLAKFDRATLFFSMDGHPTICTYLPAFDWLIESLDKFVAENPGRLATAASLAKKKLEKYYPTIENSVTPFVATFLSPVLKLGYFKEHQYEPRLLKKIKDTVNRIYRDKYSTAEVATSTVNGEDEFLNFMNRNNKPEKLSSEIQRYISDKRATSKTDILSWWKLHSEEYSGLARMERDYLGVQSTQVHVERDFSAGVDLVTANRSSLLHSNITACMCLNLWLKDIPSNDESDQQVA